MKIWCISDTHNKHRYLTIPKDIDMLIFSGDSGTSRDSYTSTTVITDFIDWLESIDTIKYKVWVAGNHDVALERGLINTTKYNSIYLEHELKEINGLKIFGSPYTPSFGVGWAYNKHRSKLDKYWSSIPGDIDILITHGPPLGILDHTENDSMINLGNGSKNVVSCGDKSLLNHVKRVKPKLHVFGHIHDEDICKNAGMMQISGLDTKFVNASVLNLSYHLVNNGFIINI